MTRLQRLPAVVEMFRSVAPAGLTIQQAADRIGVPYNTITQLVSRAVRGATRDVRLYKTRCGHSVLYFAYQADAEAFDIKAYHAAQFVTNGEKRSPLQTRIYRFLDECPKGADAEAILTHISQESGKRVEHVRTVVSEMVKYGRIVGIGPNNWKRYFAAEKVPDEAGRAVVAAEIEAYRKASKDAYRERENARKRMKNAAKRDAMPKRAKPVVKIKSQEPRRNGFMLSPKVPRPSVMLSPAAVRMLKKQIPDVPAIIPDHVKVQVCPGYRGDIRYLPQTDRVIGGFATMGIGRYLEPTQEAA